MFYSFLRFVFMALMEFCVVVIVLGDSELPNTPESPTKEKKVVKFADRVGLKKTK